MENADYVSDCRKIPAQNSRREAFTRLVLQLQTVNEVYKDLASFKLSQDKILFLVNSAICSEKIQTTDRIYLSVNQIKNKGTSDSKVIFKEIKEKNDAKIKILQTLLPISTSVEKAQNVAKQIQTIQIELDPLNQQLMRNAGSN
ncbi:hypothetical protein CROQUDRAFT_95745 [Cronartium quercuum f. sp. fusiforme G11]|uniref:Uncharacterized protein n=1 Tax=Cronartium quercuum f. sp. fusiforme G11 TaxID=708437 RepID=A0A9P6T998_9BASI|nr:hypothetical protein CROQUDRAFT_95745 [Cronartium quercuum f. sp. fusiforme G11]